MKGTALINKPKMKILWHLMRAKNYVCVTISDGGARVQTLQVTSGVPSHAELSEFLKSTSEKFVGFCTEPSSKEEEKSDATAQA